MANGYRNLQELRESTPAEMQSIPDDVLICEYSIRAEVNSNYAAQFFKPELVPLNCDEVFRRHAIESYEISTGFFGAATIAITLLLAGYFIWKITSKRSAGDAALNTGIRWGAFGVFVVFAMGVNLVLNRPLLSAIKLFLAYLVFFPSALFLIGFLFSFVKKKARSFNVKTRSNEEVKPSTSRDSEAIWEIVAREMEGDIENKALWARSFSEANGNMEGAKAIYMRIRYDQLSAKNQTKNA